jgi:hypothetical protein
MITGVDNQPAQRSTRVLGIVATVLAIVVEAASVVLTVTAFRWVFDTFDGVLYDVIGGFVWPIALHVAAIVSAMLSRRHRDQPRLRGLFIAAVVAIGVFAGLGAWLHNTGFNLIAIVLSVGVSVGGPVVVWMVLDRPAAKNNATTSAE